MEQRRDTKTPRTRSCMARDREWMDRCRRRYIRFRRAWLEEDHERVYDLVNRMWELKLYAKSGECPARCSIIRNIAQWCDHVRIHDRDNFNRWLVKSGWAGFYGWQNSKRRRAKFARSNVA